MAEQASSASSELAQIKADYNELRVGPIPTCSVTMFATFVEEISGVARAQEQCA